MRWATLSIRPDFKDSREKLSADDRTPQLRKHGHHFESQTTTWSEQRHKFDSYRNVTQDFLVSIKGLEDTAYVRISLGVGESNRK